MFEWLKFMADHHPWLLVLIVLVIGQVLVSFAAAIRRGE